MNEYEDYREMEIDYLQNQGFITNIDRKYKEIAQQAIDETGAPFEIRDGVHGSDIVPGTDLVSLWMKNGVPVWNENFWNRYEQLKEQFRKGQEGYTP